MRLKAIQVHRSVVNPMVNICNTKMLPVFAWQHNTWSFTVEDFVHLSWSCCEKKSMQCSLHPDFLFRPPLSYIRCLKLQRRLGDVDFDFVHFEHLFRIKKCFLMMMLNSCVLFLLFGIYQSIKIRRDQF